MVRPIDLLLEFLTAEEAEGLTHVHLDEGARDGLRDLFLRTRAASQPAAKPAPAAAPPSRQTPAISLKSSANPAPSPAIAQVTTGEKPEQLAALRTQAEQWAPAKSLGTLRDKLVFSAGDPNARLMLIGEAPGYDEERAGEPFAGPAGGKLTDILKAMGLKREDVYITYMVKFRPASPNQTTNNRKATAEEITAFLPLLHAEISIVKPRCIIGLGASAAEGLLGSSETVPQLRDRWHDLSGTPLRITYHPSHLLQNAGGNQIKRSLWEDMLAAMEQLELPISEKQRAYFLPKP